MLATPSARSEEDVADRSDQSIMTKCSPRNVDASFKFIKWQELYQTEKPFQIFANIPDDAEDQRLTNVDWEDKPVRVVDIRGCESEYNLDANGFEVVSHESRTHDFTNREVIEKEYLPEVEDLLKEQLDGVDRVRLAFKTRAEPVD